MFSPVFVCLLTGLLKKLLIKFIMKFYEMGGHNPGTNRLDFEWGQGQNHLGKQVSNVFGNNFFSKL